MFNRDKFLKAFKIKLQKKNFTLGRQVKPNVYEITSGTITFSINVGDARESFLVSSNEAIDNLMLQVEMDFASKYRLVSFNNAQSCIRMLLIRAEDVTEDNISADFYNGMRKIIAFSTDNQNIFPLSISYMKKWGVPADVLFAVADRNMCEVLRKTDLYVSTISGRIKVIEFPAENSRLRSSLLLCSTFRKVISDKLGSRFLIVVPSAESILAVQDVTNNIIESFGPVVLDEYRKSTYPLSTEVLLFTPNGISTAGKFQIPENNSIKSLV